MNNTEKILERVKRLLAKAEATDFPAEAETFTEAAHKLMARHCIDETLIRQAQGDEPEPLEWRVWDALRVGGSTKTYCVFVNEIVLAIGCHAYYEAGRDGKKPTMHVFGTVSLLEQAQFLISHLLMQAQTGAAQAAAAWTPSELQRMRGKRVSEKAERERVYRSFVMGFGIEAGKRIKRAHAAVLAETRDQEPGAALVLVTESDRIKQGYRTATHEQGLTLSSGRGTRVYGGFQAGESAGRSADIGQSRVGGGRRAISS